jgi:hypothetical protein
MRSFTKNLFLTLSVTCIGFSNSFSQIVLYKTNNFTGESITITENWTFQKDWPKYKNWNDVIQSVKVPAGYKVTLWGGAFGGGKQEITADWTGPGAAGGISSISIEKLPQATVATKNTLNKGETLKAGEVLTSQNGKYVLLMQEDDGNLCVYNFSNGKRGGFVWGSMKSGFKNAKLLMQTDGNLVVYDGANAPKWASNTHPVSNAKYKDPRNTPVKLVLENDGKLNLYTATNTIVWSSR